MYEYKTVPGPMTLVVKSKKQSDSETVGRYANLINTETEGGWEFYSLEQISVHEPKGCMSFSAPRTTTYNMLVFRRAK